MEKPKKIKSGKVPSSKVDAGGAIADPTVSIQRSKELDDANFIAVLKKRTLYDTSQFNRTGFFDEAPLCSRYKQLSFLLRYSRAKRDQLIVSWALGYLKEVNIAIRNRRRQSFTAITLLSFDDEWLIPRIFVCVGYVKRTLGKLNLHKPGTDFSIRVKKALGDDENVNVLEDPTALPGDTRVFLVLSDIPSFLLVQPNESGRIKPANTAERDEQ